MIPHRLRSFALTPRVLRTGRTPAQVIPRGISLVAALVVLLGAASVSAQPSTRAPHTEIPLDASAASLQPLTAPWPDPASSSDAATSASTVDTATAQEAPDTNGATVTAAGEVIEYYALDAVGSVRVVFDPAGTVVARADYMPFGETLEQTAGLPAERFTGQERDPEVGQDYFNARYYAARLGRFTSVDPVFSGAVADPQQWNRYAYARNSPLVFTDPTGLDPCVGHPPTTTSGGVTCATNQPGGGSPWPGGGYPGYSDWMCHSFGFCHLYNPPTYSPYVPPPSDPTPPPTQPVAPPPPPQRGIPIVVSPGLDADPTDAMLVTPLGIPVAAARAPKILLQLRSLIQSILGRGRAERTVIGKLADMRRLHAGERTLLDRLPNLGTPKANWAQNSNVLRQEMSRGQPIRDASIDSSGKLIHNTGFLRAERNLLQNHGWTYDPTTTMWYPPVRP